MYEQSQYTDTGKGQDGIANPMTVQFWFEFGSTYTHLSAQRIEALAAKAGVRVDWCPFLLGPIFAARGWQTSPFAVYPDKGRNMWRDVERRAALHGIPFQKPTLFPQNGLLAARVTLVALDQGWAPAFVRGVFEAQFVRGQNIADPAVLQPVIGHAGGRAQALIDAGSAEVKAALRARTEQAAELGIFGAPTFIADGEMFWGDDRLEEALAWFCGTHPAQTR